jgi:branched-subunit amino acid aminotransferase/4-amino-4-deoxychorismate lyase
MTTVWRDGRLIEAEPEAAPVEAGWGAFTTVGCDGGHPLLWMRHRSRLAASLRFLGADDDVTLPDEPALCELLRAGGFEGAARLRVVGRRKHASGWTVEAAAAHCKVAGPDSPPARLLLQRWQAAPPLAGHKTLARLPWDFARAQARREGADDALLVDEAGHVLETAIANVWMRRGRELRTPPAPARCLPGVMRGWLLEHAEALGLQVFECDFTAADLLGADELWISNAVGGVRRVASVAGRKWRHWPFFEHLEELGVPAPGW